MFQYCQGTLQVSQITVNQLDRFIIIDVVHRFQTARLTRYDILFSGVCEVLMVFEIVLLIGTIFASPYRKNG